MGGNFCFFGSRAELSQKNMKKAKKKFQKPIAIIKKGWYNGRAVLQKGRSAACSYERSLFQKEEKTMDKISAFVSEQLKTELPKFEVGDTVVVHNKIVEGTRERIQLFEGTVIAKRNGGISETFTVRRIAYGVGVEKTFPLHSPKVAKVEVIRRGKVRRAKLYYVRDRVGKAAKVKEQI